ncbi:olfactory receptor 2AT4-like [Acanthochromis polyacanthus]|uniref:olfactory receptor 2AT4-like n=1 Tax=Acanthochromis polyacanthus TaxID=80966 RepID=UPI000B8FE9D9|nr:olfactory receptor 2AT4-like [Acanthochromis polyacanthus]
MSLFLLQSEIMITNFTRMRSFFLLGFPGLSPQYYGHVSALLFFIYQAIVVGNIFITAFIVIEKSLQKPTYMVFCHLALNDLTFGTVTLPKIIAKYWFGDGIITFYGCFVQMFFVHYLGSVTSFMLLVMALDRFIAVCIPLRYPVLITNSIISVLCGFAWFIPLPLMVAVVLHALTLPYCKSNVIGQCYCDHISITSQACGEDVKIVTVTTLCVAMLCLLLPLAFILFSYIAIIVTIMKMSNVSGRKRTLSTCTPQIFITCLFYLPRCFVYVANTVGFSFNMDVRIILILLYSLLPAAVNPFIYCFKTRDIKQMLIKRLKKIKIGIEIKFSH